MINHLRKIMLLVVLCMTGIFASAQDNHTTLVRELASTTKADAVHGLLSNAGMTSGEMGTWRSADGLFSVDCDAPEGTVANIGIKDRTGGNTWEGIMTVYKGYRQLMQNLFGDPSFVSETFIGAEPKNDESRLDLLAKALCAYSAMYTMRDGWLCTISVFHEPGIGPAVFVTYSYAGHSF